MHDPTCILNKISPGKVEPDERCTIKLATKSSLYGAFKYGFIVWYLYPISVQSNSAFLCSNCGILCFMTRTDYENSIEKILIIEKFIRCTCPFNHLHQQCLSHIKHPHLYRQTPKTPHNPKMTLDEDQTNNQHQHFSRLPPNILADELAIPDSPALPRPEVSVLAPRHRTELADPAALQRPGGPPRKSVSIVLPDEQPPQQQPLGWPPRLLLRCSPDWSHCWSCCANREVTLVSLSRGVAWTLAPRGVVVVGLYGRVGRCSLAASLALGSFRPFVRGGTGCIGIGKGQVHGWLVRNSLSISVSRVACMTKYRSRMTRRDARWEGLNKGTGCVLTFDSYCLRERRGRALLSFRNTDLCGIF